MVWLSSNDIFCSRGKHHLPQARKEKSSDEVFDVIGYNDNGQKKKRKRTALSSIIHWLSIQILCFSH